ncbi:MAG: VanW family protein [Microthrixaceae bacterium]|nr:VanW family protein [Microthrixaceae bacterium]MCO5311918.1 VanW family protein [Microthrixaceae bacterium]
MSRPKALVLAALSTPVLLYLVLLGAWALFGRSDPGTVASSVHLVGVDIGGQNREELNSTLEDISSEFAQTAVDIQIPDATLSTNAGQLGLSLDSERTVRAAMRPGHADPLGIAPIRWAMSWFSPRKVDVAIDIDDDAAQATFSELEADHRVDPIEPTMAVDSTTFHLVQGQDGSGIDLTDVLTRLPSAIDSIGETITLSAEPVTFPPKLGDDAVQAVVDQANKITAGSLDITAGDESFTLTGDNLAGALSMSADGDTAELAVDHDIINLQLVSNLSIPANPTGVSFDIVNGVPTPVPGHDAQVCCQTDAADRITEALLSAQPSVELATRTITAAEGVEWASTLGVKEVIGEFTTRHAAGQARVKNIHRMSDLTRGVLIAPGETFSANDHVGKRTVEKGFVEAGVIEQGEFKEDVGGGVSQWATTTFNAAFFAGLDIVEHKPHSLYISRYPYGREATLAYPSVDLKIRNNTPYGVVIWPTYTNSSITVQMWSTRWVSGEQSAISRTSGCGENGNVSVTRTRTFVDGRTETDTFRHHYNCEKPGSSHLSSSPVSPTGATLDSDVASGIADAGTPWRIPVSSEAASTDAGKEQP